MTSAAIKHTALLKIRHYVKAGLIETNNNQID